MISAISNFGFDYRNVGSAKNRPAGGQAQSTAETANTSATTVVAPPNAAASENTGDGLSSENENKQSPGELSKEEQRELQELKQRDTEVRKHEQAHKSAAGRQATGAASFSYQTGPDGRRYAIGGEVSIDLSKGRTPEETIQKADAVRAAALAPAEPSSQDRKVAAEAARMAQTARADLVEESDEESSETAPTEAAPEGVENQRGSARTSSAPPPLSGAEHTAGPSRKIDPNGGFPVSPLSPSKAGGGMSEQANIPLSGEFTAQRAEIAPSASVVSRAYRNNLPTSAISTGDPPTGTAPLDLSA